MANIAYIRTSTKEQTIDSQMSVIKNRNITFDKIFIDAGVSGIVVAKDRPEMSKLLEYVREGDWLWIYDIDRIGRDSLDIQNTVDLILKKNVSIHIETLGLDLNSDLGKVALSVMSSFAEMDRKRIKERQRLGIQAARDKGKKFGRPIKADYQAVMNYRAKHSVSITAKKFNISQASVKRIQRQLKKSDSANSN